MWRSRDKAVLQTNFMNVAGAIEMLSALDYHYQNFVRLYKEHTLDFYADGISMDHEAVAYVNRLGQFFAFVRSDFAVNIIGKVEPLIPTIVSVMIFRNKNTAHRSIDDPRKESRQQQIQQAMPFSMFGRGLYIPREGMRQPGPSNDLGFDYREYSKKMRASSYRSYQIADPEKRTSIDFVLERDHPKIMSEAYQLVERILT